MKIAILTANLGGFDTNTECIEQILPANFSYTFHRFNDENFPPIIGLTPRFQYRIPKMFGWEMLQGYDYYLWLDGSFSLQRQDSLEWFYNKIRANNDMVLFKHPWRNTMQEETMHIEEYLQKGDRYITPRYSNGLHKEQLKECLSDPNFIDDKLFTSTVFMYKNTSKVREALKSWWLHTSHYFTVDQIALPYIVFKHYLKVYVIEENQYKFPYITLTSRHK